MIVQNQKPVATFIRKPMLLLALLVVLLGSAVNSQAQQTKTPERGFAPAGSYLLSDIESISSTGGNLFYNIPLAKLPAGRAGSSAGVSLVYNSKLYDSYLDVNCGTGCTVEKLDASPHGGWRYAYDYKLHLQTRPGRDLYNCQDPRYIYSTRLMVSFPDGSTKEFRPTGWTDLLADGYYELYPDGKSTCNGFATTGNLTYYSIDGSYIRLDVEHEAQDDGIWYNNNWTLSFPDGSRATGNNSTRNLFDSNGNVIKIRPTTLNGHTATRIFDQMEREIIIEYTSLGVDYVHQKGVNGDTLTWTINWTEIRGSDYRSMGSDGIENFYGLPFMGAVSSITLPSQAGALAYNFTYRTVNTQPLGYGEVASITLPTGASASYNYHYQGGDNFALVLQNSPTQKTLTYLREYDGASTPTTETWTYSISQVTSTPSTMTGPDGGVVREWSEPNGAAPNYSFGQVYKSEFPNGTKVERLWQENKPFGASYYLNPCVKAEFTSTKNAAGVYSLTVIKTFKYDKNGNVTEVKEYDWVNYGDVERDGVDRPTDTIPATAVLKRTTVNTYYYPTPDSSDSSTNDPDAYQNPTSQAVRSAIASGEIRDGAQTPVARAEFFYDNAANPTAGNLTLQRSWDSTKGSVTIPLTSSNSLSVSNSYDPNGYGNVTLATDAKGNQANFTYAPIIGPDGTSYPGLYVSQTQAPYTTAVQRTTQFEYDYYTGQVTKTTDADNNVVNQSTYDVFGRPTLIKQAVGTPAERWTVIEYSESLRRVITRADLNAFGDGKLVSIIHYDQLGRQRLSRSLEDASTQSAYDETAGIKVQTRYQFSGVNSYMVSSNPYRAATSSAASGETTMGWSRSKNDNGGRSLEVETFSGASLPAPWASNTSSTGKVVTNYDALKTTVIDQALKQSRNAIDGLGRLVKVEEMQASSVYATTTYQYDALDNLKQVNRGSQEARTFTYDSLKRLSSVYNPESGTVSFTYDNNSNLTQKVDARSITTTYAYDELNRVLTRTYSDSTPPVTYRYDKDGQGNAIANAKGSLTAVINSVSTTEYTIFDELGRVKESKQTTPVLGTNYAYTMSYAYNRPGALTSETYPSGRVVTSEYDAAGRLAGVKNQASNLYYVGAVATDATNRIQYTAHGAVSAMRLGNTKWEHTNFNTRLQPTQIGLGTSSSDSSLLRLDFTYGTTDNNGNVQTQQIAIAGALDVKQTYTYDQCNRLLSATETPTPAPQTVNWRQTFTYDPYGNRNFDTDPTHTFPASVLGPNPSISPSNNRINANQGYAYDTAGNVTQEPDAATQTTKKYAYDAENHQVSFTANFGLPSAQTTQYGYDGDGKRVRRINPDNTSTVFVYNAAEQLIAEYTTNTPTGAAQTSYLTTDHLGSTRVVSDASGNVAVRLDYLPFGEDCGAGLGGRTTTMKYGASTTLKQKFTGYEMDIESGLYFAQARYFSSMTGRFMSPDVPLMDQHPADPQSWNLYAYVRNNPLAMIDPDGTDCIYINDDGKTVKWIDHNSNPVDCMRTGGTWVPGYVKEENVVYNDETKRFQVASYDGVNVYYSTFAAGAVTDVNGKCLGRCKGAEIQHANAAWLSSQLVKGNTLDEMMTFMVNRTDRIHGILFPGWLGRVLQKIISGGLFFWRNQWAGPAGFGPPRGRNNWITMVHDFNYEKNDGFEIRDYFNPFISKAKSQALRDANCNLMRNGRGIQGIKFALVFGVINAYQFYVQSFKNK